MPTAKKEATIHELEEMFGRATIAIMTDYRGLKMSELTALRRRLRDAGVEFHVVKNTLGRLAAQHVGRESYQELLEGPTALALGFGDQVEASKALTEYVRTSRLNLPVRGAVLDGRVLQAAEVTTLANLPPRPVLVAMVLGTMMAPATGLVTVLSGVLSGFVRVLDGRAKQLAGN